MRSWRPSAMNCSRNSRDRKSTRLNSSHANISYAVFCLKKNRNANMKQLMAEQHPPQLLPASAIKVRQVTEVHSNSNEEQRGDAGHFSFRLSLDNGPAEY